MKNRIAGDVSLKYQTYRQVFWLIVATLSIVLAIGLPIAGYKIVMKFREILFNQVLRDNDAISNGFELFLKESRKNYVTKEEWLDAIQSEVDSFVMPGQGYICLIDSNLNLQAYPGLRRDQPLPTARKFTLVVPDALGDVEFQVPQLLESREYNQAYGHFVGREGDQLVDFRRVVIDGESWLVGVHQMESAVEEKLKEVISFNITLGLVLFLAIILPFAILTLVLIQHHEKEREAYVERIRRHTKEIELVAGQLRNTNEQLNRMQEAKNRLYARLSHDLRAPLSSILGSCDMVQEEMYGPANEKQKNAMQLVERNINVLLKLIDGILELSKLESRQVQLEPETFRLHGFLDELVCNMRPLAEKKGLELRLSVDPRLDEISTDRNRLYLILQNLIGNAVKFTEQGYVELTAKPFADSAVALLVKDTGPGIGLKDQDKIFKEFTRGVHNNRNSDGVGLGLAITKELTTLLGGSIDLESHDGEGSTFKILLPQILQQPAMTPQS
ncbi:MAG: sensor histidine kinase [Candidatus Omnitrophota bacterium]|jgi:signal transduction histidine kinase|nr:MAG: sensor histidine kinase [Candidatus Omnitrophota bacterium]